MADKDLTFWDHLDVLRHALIRILVVWFILAVGYFAAMPYLFDKVVMAPCTDDFVFYELLRRIVFYEVWRFVSPALYPGEMRGVRKALCVGTVMFFVGVLLGYFMVWPLTLRFLSTYQLSTLIENQISLNSYIDNFMMLVLCMGLAFELPLVTWLLSLLGLVNRAFLRRYRRHAAVVIVILAAVITPTGDPFTLSVVAIPLYLLYELSILMVKDKPQDTEERRENADR